ncbi:adenylyltransferase/cytidyltransferase family protein [Plantactinospora soyae]|uniref:Nicotinamide-nucleotide adenylyltransferase/phosphinothricin biosynthesis protein PhpF n=1 Tax=Plantactinospora soyae TaxID=1544732 RepID=A0A927M7W8_9ACTN|nr:adenylyltransferase/cytidyltransferase family protein [Plantactinospora soyae]MBE1489813.1 nicotinamide-nucleotide adenylyltransferase/phosphinothricin biosynthesis protein PhpF [Plantactinospora soyae]
MDHPYPLGVIHGRFQPLHLGHLEYLLAGADRCDTLVVGITNPDPWQTAEEATDPVRGSVEANPCTYYERYLMVEAALTQAGVPDHRLRIVPFPHSFPERLRYYAPPEAVYLLTIYDDWGAEKLTRLGALGLTTEVMWRRVEKPISGGRVRRAIAADDDWEQLVPPAVATVIKECGIDARIRG